MLRNRLVAFAIICAPIWMTGCFGGASRVEAPKWDVEGITDGCMAQSDEDGDGFVTKQEAKANTPGLHYAFDQLDTDEDKKLSRDEILQRFQDYADSKVGVQGFNCRILVGSRPLEDAQIRLVPEPFLEGVVEGAEGGTIDSLTGMVDADIPGDDFHGIRPGMYRVEVTSDLVKINAKYNDETILGVEVAPFTNPNEQPGGIAFRVK